MIIGIFGIASCAIGLIMLVHSMLYFLGFIKWGENKGKIFYLYAAAFLGGIALLIIGINIIVLCS